MGLSYHFGFRAPAGTPADELAGFLANVEGDARLLGFDPTMVVHGAFDTAGRQEFGRRVARGLPITDQRLRGAGLPDGTYWDHNAASGYFRLVPEYGVMLIVTDEHGTETVFGFFRYPETVRDQDGRELMRLPEGGAWISGSFVDSPDPRYRSIVRRFSRAGFLDHETDEFAPSPPAS